MTDAKPETSAPETAATVATQSPAKPEQATPVDTKPVLVKFVKPWGIYNAGETAGFPADKAAWLIEKKQAEKA